MVTTHSTCIRLFGSANISFISFIAVILELRMYAMYGRSKKILAILFVLISCEATAMGVLFGVTKAGFIGQ
jgi:hypothetical protein